MENVNLDWDIPLTAQGRVLATSPHSIDLEIDAQQFPYHITDGKLVFTGENWQTESNWFMEYEAGSHRIAYHTGDEDCVRGDWKKYFVSQPTPGIVRLNGEFTRVPAIGNYLIIRHSERIHAGIFIQESQDVKLDKVNVFHTAGHGILAQFTRNLDYRQVRFMPNAKKNRYFSGHDDGFHISNCAGHVRIASCEFGGLMDDPINVHGTSVKVLEKLGDRKLKCRFMHEQSTGMVWGHANDTIASLDNKSMATIAQGILTNFTQLNRDEFTVELRDSVPSRMADGFALENLSWMPSVDISHCSFHSCRARGLLVSTPRKVLIHKNVFESSGSAILIAGDANEWYESGAVRDITITNNLFRAACFTSMYQFCEGMISIYPMIPAVDTQKPYHSNITIEHNTFQAFDYPVLYALVRGWYPLLEKPPATLLRISAVPFAKALPDIRSL